MQESLQEYNLSGISAMIRIEKGSSLLKNADLNSEEEFVYKRAMGYKDIETREPLSPQHVFHMASVTKLLTGTAIMQLWEKNLLSLDERLADVLPELKSAPEQFSRLTIQQLLTHTSGLGNEDEFGWDMPKLAEDTLQHYILSERTTHRPFELKEEQGFYYSDTGYEFLGAVIEKKTGKSLEDYIKENIFQPLEMQDSTLLTFQRTLVLPEAESLKEEDGTWDLRDPHLGKELLDRSLLRQLPLAMAHGRAQDGTLIPEIYPYNREHNASSTLTSTADDMARFAASHMVHVSGSRWVRQLLKPDTYLRIWKPYALVPNNGEHMGLSWFIRRQEEHVFFGHEGMDDGFRASFWLCPELLLTVLVNSNVTKASTKRVAKRAASVVLEELEQK